MPDAFDPFAVDGDPLDVDDAMLDQTIRRQLAATMPTDAPPMMVLGHLRQPLRRARFVRRSQLTAGAAAAIMMVVGVSQIVPSVPDRTSLIAASPTTDIESASTLSVSEIPTTTPSSSESTMSALADDLATFSSSTTSPAPTPTTAPPAGAVAPTSAPITQSPTAPSTTTSSQPIAPSTTVKASDQETILSACGTITASSDGARIALVSTQPLTGFATVIDNHGPEELEVKFSGTTGTCEISATVRHGHIESEVSFELADGHTAEDDGDSNDSSEKNEDD